MNFLSEYGFKYGWRMSREVKDKEERDSNEHTQLKKNRGSGYVQPPFMSCPFFSPTSHPPPLPSSNRTINLSYSLLNLDKPN